MFEWTDSLDDSASDEAGVDGKAIVLSQIQEEVLSRRSERAGAAPPIVCDSDPPAMHDVRVGLCRCGHHALEIIGQHPVVGIEKHEPLAPRVRETGIASRTLAPVPLADHPEPT